VLAAQVTREVRADESRPCTRGQAVPGTTLLMSQHVTTVVAWHEALNSGDVERLVALSSADIEVGGPRGTARGASVLRGWFDRAHMRLVPTRMFQRADVIVVEQQAEWGQPGTDTPTGPIIVASVFIVRAGKVISVIRHADLASALQEAGLTDADMV